MCDELLAGLGHVFPEVEVAGHDLLVPLEGDVPTDHVVEEDAEAPHRGAAALVPVQLDPLGRRVHSRACNRKR